MTAIWAIAVVLAGGLWKFIKEMPEIHRGRRKALQEDFAFAEDFLNKLAANEMHPAAKARGLQALAGSRDVTGAEVELVLHISHEREVMGDYLLGQKYLQLNVDATPPQFEFQPKLRTERRRRWHKRLCTGVQLFAITGAVVLLIYCLAYQNAALLQVAWIGLLMLITFGAASRSMDIESAEKFMKAQEKSISASLTASADEPR